MNVDRRTIYDEGEYEGAVNAERRVCRQNVFGRTCDAFSRISAGDTLFNSHKGGAGARTPVWECDCIGITLGVVEYVKGRNDVVYE